MCDKDLKLVTDSAPDNAAKSAPHHPYKMLASANCIARDKFLPKLPSDRRQLSTEIGNTINVYDNIKKPPFKLATINVWDRSITHSHSLIGCNNKK